jgi:hypothetical protein
MSDVAAPDVAALIAQLRANAGATVAGVAPGAKLPPKPGEIDYDSIIDALPLDDRGKRFDRKMLDDADWITRNRDVVLNYKRREDAARLAIREAADREVEKRAMTAHTARRQQQERDAAAVKAADEAKRAAELKKKWEPKR